MHWPLAQLMRSRGTQLLPCASLTRGESGTLIFSPLTMTDEIAMLIRAGHRVVSQRWTAVREVEGRLVMHSLPGRCERSMAGPRAVSSMPASLHSSTWLDLEREYTGCSASHANVDRVLIIEPGRRPTGQIRRLSEAAAHAALRCAWPIAELHPQRANAQLPAKLARRCQVFQLRLSNRAGDLLTLLDRVRNSEFEAAVQTLARHETTRQLERQIAKLVGPERLAG